MSRLVKNFFLVALVVASLVMGTALATRRPVLAAASIFAIATIIAWLMLTWRPL